MKKLYTLLFALVGLTAANAAVHTVNVADFSFSPSSMTVTVGDTIRWVWVSGTHTTTSTSVPTGASSWNANITSSSTTFSYVVPAAGTYNYRCSIHPTSMMGSFTATSGVGIIKNNSSSAIVLFPNPAKDKLTITHDAVDAIRIYDMVGATIMNQPVEATETKTVIEVGTLPSGVYFVNTMKDGIVTDTRRLVKVN
jgi:plastocyanin